MRADLTRALAVALTLALLAGCADGPSAALVAWLGRVDAALVRAEAERAAGDRDSARVTLQAALDDPPPARDAPLARALRENLWFALGRVELEADRPREALAAADRGLASREDPTTVTVFTASLHALRALALEALARPDDAIRAWEAAQIVHTRLFERALEEEEEAPR